MPEERGNPQYYGMFKHVDRGGFALWFPTGWQRYRMKGGHHGVIYGPHPDNINTSFTAEKRRLPYKVTLDDVPTLREGFQAGLVALPGIEIESQDEAVTSPPIFFEARYTFLEGEIRRKRWTRVIYWGRSQLVLMAQGETAEEFEYWLPMFFNTMMTIEIL